MNNLYSLSISKDFWHGEKTVGKNFSSGKLGGYYNNLEHKTLPYSAEKSSEGVPLVYLGKQRYALHPVTVCQVGLGWYERWLDQHQESFLERFVLLADWLVANQEIRPAIGGVWPVPYRVPVYGLKEGWISALVQGQAISVLSRAYHVSKKDCYFAALKFAVQPFSVPVELGGVLRQSNDNEEIFFEEYPSLETSKVLNGFISSLWGLYDYLLVENDKNVRFLFESGINTLINNLPTYDTGYWSRYSQFDRPGVSNLASPYYHKEHIEQLKANYLLTGNPLFSYFANKWENYFNNAINICSVITIKILSKINSSLFHK